LTNFSKKGNVYTEQERRFDQHVAETQARHSFMRGYLDRSSFAVILTWAGWNGLDIVEEIERLEQIAEPFIGTPTRKYIIDSKGNLCLIQNI
jgi:hypothetical protein